MSSFSKKSIRSISLPCRSHPSTNYIEEEINKHRTSDYSSTPTSEAIINSLCSLVELYKSMDELLVMPQTIQSLYKHRDEKWVDEIMEGPMKLLDVCAISRDMLVHFKENVRDVLSSLRRRKDELSIEASITKFASFRQKMKKDSKKLMGSLKQMEQNIEGSLLLVVDQHVSALLRVLLEVNALSITVFQSVMSFLTAPKKTNKWSISRFVNRDQQENEVESIDNTLRSLCRGEEDTQSVQNRLQNLETCFQRIETGLEDIFRCMIKSRTFLLNIFSS